MTDVSKAFTATGSSSELIVQPGETLRYAVTGTFVGSVAIQRGVGGGNIAWDTVATYTTTQSATDIKNATNKRQRYRWTCTAYTSGTATCTLDGLDNQGAIESEDFIDLGLGIKDDLDPTKIVRFQASGISTGTTRTLTVPDASTTLVGTDATQTLTNKTLTSPTLTSPTVNSATINAPTLTGAGFSVTPNATDATVGTVASPVSGTTAVTIARFGSFFRLDFTLTSAAVPCTDATSGGSYGTLKLFDFAQGSLLYVGCRQNYTAFSEGAALTGGAGDASFDIGIGSVAIASAADGALTGTNDDIGSEVNVTLSGGTGTGTSHTGASVAHDGTGSAGDLNLNWSGTAATIDASANIYVTGTITVVGMLMGDD